MKIAEGAVPALFNSVGVTPATTSSDDFSARLLSSWQVTPATTGSAA